MFQKIKLEGQTHKRAWKALFYQKERSWGPRCGLSLYVCLLDIGMFNHRDVNRCLLVMVLFNFQPSRSSAKSRVNIYTPTYLNEGL